MQRLDGVPTYQNQMQQAGRGTAPTSGTEHASSVRQGMEGLAKGTVFEGTITDVRGSQVQLRLSNGQTIQAQLDKGVNVRVGEPVLFEVKSNQDGQIMLRQVPTDSTANPTLLQALRAAGLPANQKNMEMVDLMMRGQMPIDQKSLHDMARLFTRYPDASAETLLQMQKLGFPIDEQSIQQFEAYKAGEHALLDRFTQLMDQLPDLPGAGGDARELLALQNQLLDILELGQGTADGAQNALLGEALADGAQVAGEADVAGAFAGNAVDARTLAGEALAADAQNALLGEALADAQAAGTAGQVDAETLAAGALADDAQNALLGEALADGAQNALTGDVLADAQATGTAGQADVAPPVSTLFSEAELEGLAEQLRQIPGMEEDPQLFVDGKLNAGLGAKEMLALIRQNLSGDAPMEASLLKELFSSKEYKGLVKQAIREQWMLTPEQVADKENVDRLYERLDRQMQRLQQFLQNTDKASPAMERQVTQVRGNLEMMNQINQLYNYVQIPLRLLGQNAHSDLYVYMNKKRQAGQDGTLTALLHLELENLGTTDVHIKMQGNRVSTNFYLSDESAFRLVGQHTEDLQARLEEKGYHCSIQLENRAKETDFVQDFLASEAPLGELQRYSFDVLT